MNRLKELKLEKIVDKKYKCLNCASSYPIKLFGISKVTNSKKPYCKECSDKIYLKKIK
jgi:DNA-directed RNA polymerase subunit RPC12/RpoP